MTGNGTPRVVMKRHGMSGSSIYLRWHLMRRRCEKAGSPGYENYGGRGIRVCERWRNFAEFYEDMGSPPGPGFSLDRVDNDGNYEPGNCRWATRAEQSRNTRVNRVITHAGKTQCLTDWARELGVTQSTLAERLNNGLSTKEALVRSVHRLPGSQSPDITGKRYGSLVAIRYSHTVKRIAFWVFRCDCGNETTKRAYSVKSRAATASCGCGRRTT